MFIEIWEKVRGYDKWPSVRAVVRKADDVWEEVSYVRGPGSYFVKDSLNLMVWSDANATEHKALFVARKGSRLYEIKGEQSLDIRLSPFNPNGYYSRELFQAKARRGFLNFAMVLLIVIAIAFFVWVKG